MMTVGEGELCFCTLAIHYIHVYIHGLMRDEKEGRKKQARLNKQQSNTAHVVAVVFIFPRPPVQSSTSTRGLPLPV